MDDAALDLLWLALSDERYRRRLIGRLRPRLVGRPHPTVRLSRRRRPGHRLALEADSADSADPAAMPSPDSADPVAASSAESADAAADGVRLAELVAMLPLSRSSVFELVKVLGIVTAKGPGPDGRGRVAWVGAADADRITEAAHRVDRGEVRIADLAHGLQRRQTPQTLAHAVSAGSADSPDAGPFLARLEAAERAIASGLGLSTAETAWILGVRPGSSPLTRGGITATRTGWNCWRLQSADSADSADDL